MVFDWWRFVAQEDWLEQSLASALCLSPIRISYEVQRIFRLLLAGMPVLDCPMRPSAAGRRSAAPPGAAVVDLGAIDEARMREIYSFTARTLETKNPVPFGALIVNTKTGERLMRATNAVRRENDPSSHAEVRTVRLACKKLKRTSLGGFTMYSTCEPCPMCMANALWAGLDRVVYGATIADASLHCLQIHISADEVARRADMRSIVGGPVLRELCNTLFTHPNMQKAFSKWNSVKKKVQKA
jgi:tRNA(Arg) A34 adenosine deaminase TadA